MFGFHGWLHLVTIWALAMVLREYLTMKAIINEEHRVKLWHSDPILEPPTSKSIEDDLPPLMFSSVNINSADSAAFNDMVANKILTEGTSVWCQNGEAGHADRLCRFRNLCYLPAQQDFVFFHHNSSMIHNVPRDRFNPPLLELSSVRDHSEFYFNYVDMPAEKAALLLHGATYIKDTTLAYKRFLPDNIMHVFHDDLLPMFFTLQLITTQYTTRKLPFEAQLLIIDDHEPGLFMQLYNLFTYLRPIYKQELRPPRKPVCFRDAYFGISKQTTWYDYGFYEPQKAIENHNISGSYVRYFAEFLRNRIGISSLDKNNPNISPETNEVHASDASSDNHKPIVVLFLRKSTRLITNVNELIMALIKRLSVKVTSVYVEDMTIKEIIEQTSHASLAIGMHGSLLSFAIFLPPGAMLIELFPYALNPDNYTPYKTLANLPGMDLKYKAWRNMESRNSKLYPDRSWQQGGISHLSKEMQDKIRISMEVKPHLCCNDPEFLFRINQDTEIHVDDVLKIASDYFYESTVLHASHINKNGNMAKHTGDINRLHLYPNTIENMTCVRINSDANTVNDRKNDNQMLRLSWLPPWNIPYLQYASLMYEVLLLRNNAVLKSKIVKTTSHSFILDHYVDDVTLGEDFLVKVRCVTDHVKGPYNSKQVHC